METPRSSKRDYDQEILKCLEEGVMGLTITDIAKTLGISRNTVAKYLKVLEVKDIVNAQDVGVYRLYFLKTQRVTPPGVFSSLFSSLFWGMMAGLKKLFPDHPEMFKKVGGEIDQTLNFPLIGGKLEEIVIWLGQLSNREFLNVLLPLLPRIFFIAENSYVKSYTIDAGDERATYQLTNTPLLQKDEYLYGLNIMAGFLESYFQSKYHKKIECDIVRCKFSEIPTEGYVEIAIRILK